MSNTEKVHGDGTFVKGSVCIVDYDAENRNILVRGSSAFGATNFKMSDLISTIKGATFYKETGINLSSNPMVVDFCLIGFAPDQVSKDQGIVYSEIGWFTGTVPPPPPAVGPVKGHSGPYPTYINDSSLNHIMAYWPVLSLAPGSPNTTGGTWEYSPALSISADNNGFNFDGLVPAIRNALTNNITDLPAGFPASGITDAIIYVHCDSGVNRTGAAIISYLLTYGSNIPDIQSPLGTTTPYTMENAQKAALVSAPSNNTPPGGVDINVAQAYCNWRQTGDVDGKLVTDCILTPNQPG